MTPIPRAGRWTNWDNPPNPLLAFHEALLQSHLNNEPLSAFQVKFGMLRFDLHTPFQPPSFFCLTRTRHSRRHVGYLIYACLRKNQQDASSLEKSHTSDDNVKVHTELNPKFDEPCGGCHNSIYSV